jgi:bacillopeptidase F (M6 metalloprotease family)
VACSPTPIIFYSQDFSAGDGGYTHSGTADEWEFGLPTFAPVTGCNTGTTCWKTDLDNTYNANSTQDLVSPPINLTAVTGPVNLRWAMKYQIETAVFDHAFVEIRQVGGANPRIVWQWLGPTMTTDVGSPPVTIQESAGWGFYNADISAYAGQMVELRFHLDSDGSVNHAGLAIDDVRIDSCPVPVELQGFSVE